MSLPLAIAHWVLIALLVFWIGYEVVRSLTAGADSARGESRRNSSLAYWVSEAALLVVLGAAAGMLFSEVQTGHALPSTRYQQAAGLACMAVGAIWAVRRIAWGLARGMFYPGDMDREIHRSARPGRFWIEIGYSVALLALCLAGAARILL